MILTKSGRAILFHIQKTAGSSIEEALLSVGWSRPPEHSKNTNSLICPDRFLGFRAFCTVRHPYARLVSGWWFYCRERRGGGAVSGRKTASFFEFVEYCAQREVSGREEPPSGMRQGFGFDSQSELLSKTNVDIEFLRCEEMPECLDLLPGARGLDVSGYNVNRRRTKRPPIAEFFTDKDTRENASMFAARDCCLFGYDIDDFDQPEIDLRRAR